MTGFYIFISIFSLTCLVHLYLCFTNKDFFRKITKCFCLLFLGISTLFVTEGIYQVLIPLSCMFAILGDFFLIWPKKLLNTLLGGAAFLVEHIINLVIIVTLLTFPIPFYVYIIIGAVLVALALTGLKIMKSAYGLAAGYAGILLTLMVFSIILLANSHNPIFIMLLVGYLLFIISDSVLAMHFLDKNPKGGNFTIMITYLVAQTLIILCFCFGI